MKKLLFIICLFTLFSCEKEILAPSEPVTEVKQLTLDGFSSFFRIDRTYFISEYTDLDHNHLEIPDIVRDDLMLWYNGDGMIASQEPCIEYHYNWVAYAEPDGTIKFKWLTMDIKEATFTLVDYVVDDYFVLKLDNTLTKYKFLR